MTSQDVEKIEQVGYVLNVGIKLIRFDFDLSGVDELVASGSVTLYPLKQWLQLVPIIQGVPMALLKRRDIRP